VAAAAVQAGHAGPLLRIGYELLAPIAARAGAKPLPDLYRARIFKPLGLRQTACDPPGPISGRHARGYLIGADGIDDRRDQLALGRRRRRRHRLQHSGDGGIPRRSHARQGPGTPVAGDHAPRHLAWRSNSGCAGNAYGWGGAGDAYKTDAFVNAGGSRVAVLLLNARRYDGRDDATAMQTMIALYCAA